MLIEDVFHYVYSLQHDYGLTEEELVMAMMAFTWCNKKDFERLLKSVGKWNEENTNTDGTGAAGTC